MEMKLDAATVEGLVSKAIFDLLTPEKRDELIQGAIQSLMKRPVGSGFNQMSELERLFADAASNAARKVVTARLEADPSFEAGVKQVFEKAWKSAFEGDAGGKLAERMAAAFRQSITGDRY